MIVFDEIDAICRTRGGMGGGGGGAAAAGEGGGGASRVSESVVNQLLAKLDGARIF